MCFTWDDVSQQFLQIGKTLCIDSMFKSSNRVLFFCSLAMSDLIDTDGRLRLSGKYLQSRLHPVKIMPGIVAKRKQQRNTNKASKTNKENQHNANTNKNQQEPNQTTLISAVSYHYVPRHHYMPPSVKLQKSHRVKHCRCHFGEALGFTECLVSFSNLFPQHLRTHALKQWAKTSLYWVF